MTQEIDDGLTDEERAALALDEDEGTPNTDADDGTGGDDGESSKGEEDKGPDSGDDKPADTPTDTAPDTKTDDESTGTTETVQQSAPVLVAEVPENVDAQFADIASRKGDILEQFDNGDITAKEYQIALDALNKQERTLERAVERAETAAQMEKQRLENDWKSTVNSFIGNNSIYKDNPRLYRALDAEVRELATKPETANWSGQRFLDEAHKNLKAAFGFQDGKPTPKRETKQDRDLPPNLAKIPAADVEDTNGGRFAVLDRLANTDPVAYEETLNKMSAAERDAYLSA